MMEIANELSMWFRTMGYDGEIPDSLVSICNNSTRFIWEQLMQNVKPKQEVEHIRRNIILDRLKKEPLDKQDEFLYSMKEIECFRRKQSLDQKIDFIKMSIADKQNRVGKLSANYKIQCITLDSLKKRIKENEEREFLLGLKANDLQNRLQQARDDLSTSTNITPVELQQSMEHRDIKEVLESCAKKLQNILIERSNKLTNNVPQKSFTRPQTCSKRKLPNVSFIETYLSKQEADHFEQVRFSCSKNKIAQGNKEKIPSNNQKPINVELFKTPKILVSNDDKHNDSLGILPDIYLRDGDDEKFLFTSVSDEDLVSLSTLENESNSSSVIFNASPSVQENNYSIFLYNDNVVNADLLKLLKVNNKELLHLILQAAINDMKMEFTKLLSDYKSFDNRTKKINQQDITGLLHIHVRTEIKIMKQKRIIKELLTKIGRSRFAILNAVRSKENLFEIQERLDTTIKQIGLEASLTAMRKEIDSVNFISDDKDLQIITLKIAKVKNEVAKKMDQTNFYVEEMYKLQKLIATSREEIINTIWNMKQYKNDMSWIKPLTENLWSTEIQLFEHFPLEYQRKCTFTDPKVFYRDLCVDNYPLDVNLSTEALQMIFEMTDSPFSPPEKVLFKVIKDKIKLEKIKSLRKKDDNKSHFPKYSIEELEQKEGYVDYALERLKSILYSQNCNSTLSTADVVTKTMEIWTEMPMKDFISDRRLVNGQTYRWYENKVKSFCVP